MRTVFDTNVLVSALFSKTSVPRQAFEKAASSGHILISLAVFVELSEVLNREKLSPYFTEAERLQFLARVINLAIPVEIDERIEVCRDPKDDKFLELGISGNADYIVTGDKDLLELHPFRGISILTPKEYLITDLIA